MNVLVQHRDAALRRDVVGALASLGVRSVAVAGPRELRAHLDEAGCDALLVQVEGRPGEAFLDGLVDLCQAPPALGLCSDRRAGAVVAALRLGLSGLVQLPIHLADLEQGLARLRREAHEPVVPGLRVDAVPATAWAGPDPGCAPVPESLLCALQSAAESEATVVVVGEGDTGRRRVAAQLHARSRRRAGPLVVVPCGQVSPAELLGAPHTGDAGERLGALRAGDAGERLGALRAGDAGERLGALRAGDAGERLGALQRARGGTLVLHEILELPAALQAPLLEQLVAPGSAPAAGGPRLVVTARAPLSAEAGRGRLLPNLCRRLDVLTLDVPPLRERPDDVVRTARALLRRLGRSLDLPVPELSAQAEAQLRALPLRGNHAELEGTMRRAILLAPGRTLDRLPELGPPRAADDPAEAAVGAGPAGGAEGAPGLDLRTLERDAIVRSLRATRGNRTHAARALGISVRTLRDKIRRYGLAESNPPESGVAHGARSTSAGQILPPDRSV